jgi:threonine dehydrogenase-like Zn-dependent dehydrogenase
MRALFFDGQVILRDDCPRPEPRPTEALVKVVRAGICRTDLEITKGYMGFKGVMGHEFVGVVEKCHNRQWINRRVVSEINISCGECIFCRSNLSNHCPSRSVIGLKDRDGCFAEYIALPINNLHLVPDSVSDEEATFIEPVAACFEVLEQVHIHPKNNTVVLGAGKLGLLMAQVMKLHGNDVTIVAKHPEKLETAQQLGLKAYPASEVRERSKNVIDCTGTPEGFDLAQRLVIPRGRIILKSTFTAKAPIDPASIVVNEIEVVGSRCGPFRPAVNALQRKLVDIQPLISGRYPLSRGLKALDQAAESSSLKILLTMEE